MRPVFDIIASATSDAVLVVDESGELVFWNASARELLGSCEGSEQPRRLAELEGVFEQDRTTAVAAADYPLARALREGIEVEVELFLRRGPLTPACVRARAQVVTEGDDRWGVMWLRNITREHMLADERSDALEQLERMVRQRTRELRDSNAELARARHLQAVGRLASGLAHDFNNMLTIIASYASMANLRAAKGDSAAREILEIERTVDRAAELTSQLLAFSRRDPGRPELIGLGAVIDSCEKLLRRLIGEHIDLEIETEDELGTVRIDPVHAQQLVIHLVFNARDSMPDGGVICVTARNVSVEGRELVELRVADSGGGLGADEVVRLISGELPVADSGPAIGLAAVRSILPAYQGRLSGESVSGEGSAFVIQLPRLDDIERPARRDYVSHDSKGVVVLLVEDDERVRSVAKEMLSASGYQVFEASGAEGALELMASERPEIDLLLTDVVMSGRSGTELASRLREQMAHMKVLYMSGYDDEMLARHSKQTVSGPLLQKPFSVSELLGKIREALDSEPN